MAKVKIGDKVKYFDAYYGRLYGDGNLTGTITELVFKQRGVEEVDTEDGVWGARIQSDKPKTSVELSINMNRYHVSEVITLTNKGK